MSQKRPIRVLVADDSPTARELLSAIIASDPAFALIGQAHDGQQAVQLARSLRPDVVVMDVYMPRLDGFAATQEIMAEFPVPIVVISSSYDARDVTLALHALHAGALTVFRKPADPLLPEFAEQARRFLDTVRLMSDVKVVRLRRSAKEVPPPVAMPLTERGNLRSGPRVLAIATSTGGPAALYRLLSDLPETFSAPILVTQHTAAGFLPGLVSWLGTAGSIAVKIADDREPILPRTLYLSPDDRHLGVSRDERIALSSEPPIRGFRPSGTFLFQSVAKTYGGDTAALILTGMGDDGVAGLHAVHAAGGVILAESESSCAVYGMPGAAVASGVVHVQLPLTELGAYVATLFTGQTRARP